MLVNKTGKPFDIKPRGKNLSETLVIANSITRSINSEHCVTRGLKIAPRTILKVNLDIQYYKNRGFPDADT